MTELTLQTEKKGRPSTKSLKNLLKQVSASHLNISASAFDSFKKTGLHMQEKLDASTSRAKEVKGELLRKIIAEYADRIGPPARSVALSHSDVDSECNMRRNSFSSEVATPQNSVASLSSSLSSFTSDDGSEVTTRANSLASLRSASMSGFSISSTNSGSGRRIDENRWMPEILFSER
ncbi:hypothetical protein [Glaciimonas sp. PCH181]|uniref:hypothetical protein n=1 Tax=Glaciimonas sp. PCH181 TaxID=2133943 RepID=UPI0011B267BC|nr:hypothetical protein [Glaciimonas sp. PCH181]